MIKNYTKKEKKINMGGENILIERGGEIYKIKKVYKTGII